MSPLYWQGVQDGSDGYIDRVKEEVNEDYALGILNATEARCPFVTPHLQRREVAPLSTEKVSASNIG